MDQPGLPGSDIVVRVPVEVVSVTVTLPVGSVEVVLVMWVTGSVYTSVVMPVRGSVAVVVIVPAVPVAVEVQALGSVTPAAGLVVGSKV
jgi:hypothetical protein